MARDTNERGQATVELVLLLPIILLMVCAVVEFGFALNSYLTVHNAAAEGARYGSLGSMPGDGTCAPNTIRGRALSAAAGQLDCSDIAVSYPGGVGTVSRGDEVAVRVTREYGLVTPLSALMGLAGSAGFPESLTLSACSSGRLEQAPSPAVAHGGSSCN